MRYTKNWKEYELIDATNGNRLERWGDKILIRPDPQIIWNTEAKDIRWKNADGIYHRSNSGGGSWEVKNKDIQTSWNISYNGLKFGIKIMNFKHTGVFPEQAINWDLLDKIISSSENKKMNVLNLFAYTGGATLASAKAGAKVCHVDASKGMVSWARENAKMSNLENSPIRWIVDDCEKFVLREIRRNNKYDGIIMDPPSYGRGPNGEIWKIEDNLFEFVKKCEKLLSDNPEFLIVNSYSTGFSASTIEYLVSEIIKKKHGGFVVSSEIGIKVMSSGLILPSGSTVIWSKKKWF